jgi:hypothetical protein
MTDLPKSKLVEMWVLPTGSVVAAIREDRPDDVPRIVNVSMSVAAIIGANKEPRTIRVMLCFGSDRLSYMVSSLMALGEYEDFKAIIPKDCAFQIRESQEIMLEVQPQPSTKKPRPAIQVT